MTGAVVSFDEEKGFGTVRRDDGREFFFHCTQITDASRVIDVGTKVRFDVIAGHRGQWEASRVEKQ